MVANKGAELPAPAGRRVLGARPARGSGTRTAAGSCDSDRPTRTGRGGGLAGAAAGRPEGVGVARVRSGEAKAEIGAAIPKNFDGADRAPRGPGQGSSASLAPPDEAETDGGAPLGAHESMADAAPRKHEGSVHVT